MDNLLHHALDVAVALSRVDRAQLGRALAVRGVGAEDRPRALALGTNDATHLRQGGEAGRGVHIMHYVKQAPAASAGLRLLLLSPPPCEGRHRRPPA